MPNAKRLFERVMINEEILCRLDKLERKVSSINTDVIHVSANACDRLVMLEAQMAAVSKFLHERGYKIVKDDLVRTARFTIESMPEMMKDGREVLLWYGGTGPQVCWYCSGHWRLTWNNHAVANPTHWAPCPGEE